MWDIKKTQLFHWWEEQGKYYLNHVGYKVKKITFFVKGDKECII